MRSTSQARQLTCLFSGDGDGLSGGKAGNLFAHAVLGAVVAELQGNSALVGGASAVSGELAAPIIQKALYGDRKIKDLL